MSLSYVSCQNKNGHIDVIGMITERSRLKQFKSNYSNKNESNLRNIVITDDSEISFNCTL